MKLGGIQGPFQADDLYLLLVTSGIHFFAKNLKHPSFILCPFSILSQNVTAIYCSLNSFLHINIFF